eukprot:SM001680S02645  [mRNA]  locus=s1680:54:749:+ [translate_table: standard]
MTATGDGNAALGLPKWLADYRKQRPGFEELRQRMDAYMAEHDAREERAKQEREAQAAKDDGWTLVVGRLGRRKTTEAATGVTVGAVAPAAVAARKRSHGQQGQSDFYRFQRRETHRSEVLELQQRFEDDKRRISQMKAARKFRPY